MTVAACGCPLLGTNLLATVLVIVGAVALTRLTSSLSPRPPLHLGVLTVNPHALQWGVVGFGALVIVNLLQRLQVADRPAFEVITRSPALLLCIGVGALQMMINYGAMGFTPSFLMKHYGLSPATTGLQFGLLAGALGIVGPLIAGPLSDRINVRFPGAGRVVGNACLPRRFTIDRDLGLPRADPGGVLCALRGLQSGADRMVSPAVRDHVRAGSATHARNHLEPLHHRDDAVWHRHRAVPGRNDLGCQRRQPGSRDPQHQLGGPGHRRHAHCAGAVRERDEAATH